MLGPLFEVVFSENSYGYRPGRSALQAVVVMEKGWKEGRRHLLALGADPAKVHMATRSRKGYWRMSQNEIVRFALNNRWLEEQGVPDMIAPTAIAALKNAKPDRMDGGTESKPLGSFFTTGQRPQANWNRPVRSRTQDGVGPGS